MQTIIQLSDFHINSSMCNPGENKVFSKLIDTLRCLNLENIILVYNGDVIDSGIICNAIEDSLMPEEKAQIWEEEASKAYEKAKEYFNFLTENLSIPNDRIIICCGNHDVNPYYLQSEEFDCPGQKQKISYNPDRFNQFVKFCDSIQLHMNTSGMYYREVDNINFLILNTNWINKWDRSIRSRLCIACNDVQQIIAEQRDKLIRTKNKKSKLLNVLIAHAPSTDYCEEALYSFKENQYSAVMSPIDCLFGLKLYGDKHTDSIHNFDYIVGAPLNSEIITCGIHQFDECYHHHYKSLVCSNGEWKVVGAKRDIKEILRISADSIKTQTLQYLFGSREIVDLDEKITNFEEVRSSEKWNALDSLIRSYTDIKKTQRIGAGEHINTDDGFINTLTRLISDSNNRVSVTLRGETRVGKSVCMSLLYMNLLHRFVCGTFEYMPIYINLEMLVDGLPGRNRDSNGLLTRVRSKVVEKLRRGITLARSIQRPACCLIDGINKYFVYRNARVEEVIASLLEGEYGRQYAHLVYCIDTGNNNRLGSTPQDVQKNAEYVVYFNRILTQKLNSQKKYKNFVKAFCVLQQEPCVEKTSEVVLNNIERMNIMQIDTNLFINFWDELRTENETDFFTLVDRFVHDRIKTIEFHDAGKVCFLYHIKGKCYTDISQIYKIKFETFELIRTQEIVARYLLASNYVESINNMAEPIDKDSCFNIMYNHDVCTFIREYIHKYSMQNLILEFATDRYEELSYEGKATLSYMLGRIKCEQYLKTNVLNFLDNCLSQECVVDGSRGIFAERVSKRSVYISKLFIGGNFPANCATYIEKLITDDYERRINRALCLKFYGDRPNSIKDVVMDGFDIYNTYNILASHLKTWEDTRERHILLDLELFTLCDLLQQRLETSCAIASNGKKTVSFFYNDKFNFPHGNSAVNVINFIVNIIEEYLDCYGQSEQSKLFIKYLYMQQEQFNFYREKLINGPLDPRHDEYAPSILLNQLSRLENIKRVGWNIDDIITGTIANNSFKRIQKKGTVFETSLHHTYEAFLIGLLYLPKTSYTHTSYDKQKILNMLLIHDFGKVMINDIVPEYEKYSEKKVLEKTFCKNLFLQGTHSDVADLTEYLYLWESWVTDINRDYNIQIAKEIHKIQILYKLMILLDSKKITFSLSKVKRLWNERTQIETSECKRIFDVLLVKSQKFINVAQEYGLSLSKLAPGQVDTFF